MKLNRKSVLPIALAAALAIGVGAVFMTSAVKQDESPEKIPSEGGGELTKQDKNPEEIPLEGGGKLTKQDKGLEEILQEDGEEIKNQAGGILSEALNPLYSIENWEFVVDSIDGNRADCQFFADWVTMGELEDDPWIRGMYQAAEALTDEQEKAFAIVIAEIWTEEMRSWEKVETDPLQIVVLLDEKGKWSLHYPYVMAGVETLKPLEEYIRTVDETERCQQGIDLINGAIELERENKRYGGEAAELIPLFFQKAGCQAGIYTLQ